MVVALAQNWAKLYAWIAESCLLLTLLESTVRKFAGGSDGPMIRFLHAFSLEFGNGIQLGHEFWECIAKCNFGGRGPLCIHQELVSMHAVENPETYNKNMHQIKENHEHTFYIAHVVCSPWCMLHAACFIYHS